MTTSMTMPLPARRILLAASLLSAIGIVTACNESKLLTAPTPDVVLPKDISSRAALPSAFAAAVGDFQLAYGGGYGGQAPLLD